MKPTNSGDGYLVVSLGRGNNVRVHRLVGELFIPNPAGKPEIKQLAEMYGVDPKVISLIQTGKAYKNCGGTVRPKQVGNWNRFPDETRKKIRYFHEEGFSNRTIAEMFGCTRQAIWRIVNEK